MKTRICAVVFASLLTSCYTRPSAEHVENLQREITAEQSRRIDQAAGAVAATGKLLSRNPPALEAAMQTNNAAAYALPKPAADTAASWDAVANDLVAGNRGGLDHAIETLAASETRQRELERKLESARSELQAALEKQAAIDRERASTAESRKSIVEKQTLGLTAAGVLMLAAAAIALYRTHALLAGTLGGLGLLLIVVGRITATLPDWSWSVLFAAGCASVPAALWFGYRRGLFQHPPESLGDYRVSRNA